MIRIGAYRIICTILGLLVISIGAWFGITGEFAIIGIPAIIIGIFTIIEGNRH